jgi:hypothetical protein
MKKNECQKSRASVPLKLTLGSESSPVTMEDHSVVCTVQARSVATEASFYPCESGNSPLILKPLKHSKNLASRSGDLKVHSEDVEAHS